jgi:hypothetical protein
MNKIAWRWISYDVWGNSDDGYEVNAAYPTSVVYRLSLEASNETILKTVWDDDANEVEIESYSNEDTIYFVSKDDGKPLGEIRRIEE